ncbi:MAG: outer membrane protein assembly factor BamB family protein, partial [Candidatus Kariarchaeaceae archaeon]
AKDASPPRRLNWPIIVGFVLVTFIIILAIIGPNIAPNDPGEEVNITRIEGEWYVPPFDIGTPGYPLGSDSFGRDLYSRLLWGIRPTMIMVVIVAVVRLVLGVIIGLCAGWFGGKTGNFLNGIIQLALALPVLLVALGAIAIVGVELGIWAFIIGLSLTGWVDTALQVREQTRIVKGQVYVEAASAMGASNQQILSNHILKQISPMLLMLFAFEISSTLMLTAGLGFLGYYIGGDVWIDTDDFVARRISGNPELGQMLATSWVTLTKPWAMVAVGTTLFITILGFNLIGEGLRQNMGFAKVQKRGLFADQRNQISIWLDQNVWHPVIQFARIKQLRYGLIVIAAFFFLSTGALVMLDQASRSDVTNVLSGFGTSAQTTQGVAARPTDEDFPADGSTQEVPIQVNTYDPSIVWDFYDESGFSGGPTISSDGKQLFAASQEGNLYSLDLDGNIIWQTQLSSGVVGTPILDESENIIVAEKNGVLTKFSPQGEPIWQFQSKTGDRSLAGPVVGPDGTIYYTVGTVSKGYIQAVSPSGDDLWVTDTYTSNIYEQAEPSKDGEYVFLKSVVFSPDNGELIELDTDLDVRRYFSGENGNNYLVAGHNIIEWEQNGNAIEIIDVTEWDSSNISSYSVPTSVIVTEDGVSGQLYTSPGGITYLIWISQDDQSLGSSEVRISSGRLVAMQNDLTAFVCGGGSFNPNSTDCASISPTSNEPLWQFHLGDYGPVAGGVIADKRYFVTTEDGYLFEINENLEKVITQSESDSNLPTQGTPSEVGVMWTYQASDTVAFDINSTESGLVYFTTNDGNFHILEPNGKVHNVIELPANPYHRVSQSGRSAPTHISPRVLQDGTIILVSDENIAYALDSEGSQLWEHSLDGEPAEVPLIDEVGNFYLLDLESGLNSFNKDGFNWRFQSDVANLPAHGFTLDREGNIYYVVTNYSKGFIQAVSSSGDEIWASETPTNDFYDDLHISPDGQFISLAEDLFETSSGEIITYNPENRIDEFIFGDSGHNFMRSQHTVAQWQYGPSGIEILSEGIASEEDATPRPPLGSSADSKGIVWLYYPESYTGGGTVIVWMTAEGELLGRRLIERSIYNFVSIDMENSLLTECWGFEQTQTLECKAYSPNFAEPVWEVQVEDIPPFIWGEIEGEQVFLIGEDNSITALHIGNPN